MLGVIHGTRVGRAAVLTTSSTLQYHAEDARMSAQHSVPEDKKAANQGDSGEEDNFTIRWDLGGCIVIYYNCYLQGCWESGTCLCWRAGLEA